MRSESLCRDGEFGSWSSTPSLQIPACPGALARMGSAWWGDQPGSGLGLVWSSMLGHGAEGPWVMGRGLGDILGRRQSREEGVW